MDNKSPNPSTGSKGVFPGTINQNNKPVYEPPQGQQASNKGQQPQQSSQPAQPQQPQQPSQTNHVEPKNENKDFNMNKGFPDDAKTYFKLETKNVNEQISGVLEIDLISFRERGKESRYLSINTIGANSEGSGGSTLMSIDNEEDFNKFKEFMSQLNWND